MLRLYCVRLPGEGRSELHVRRLGVDQVLSRVRIDNVAAGDGYDHRWVLAPRQGYNGDGLVAGDSRPKSGGLARLVRGQRDKLLNMISEKKPLQFCLEFALFDQGAGRRLDPPGVGVMVNVPVVSRLMQRADVSREHRSWRSDEADRTAGTGWKAGKVPAIRSGVVEVGAVGAFQRGPLPSSEYEFGSRRSIGGQRQTPLDASCAIVEGRCQIDVGRVASSEDKRRSTGPLAGRDLQLSSQTYGAAKALFGAQRCRYPWRSETASMRTIRADQRANVTSAVSGWGAPELCVAKRNVSAQIFDGFPSGLADDYRSRPISRIVDESSVHESVTLRQWMAWGDANFLLFCLGCFCSQIKPENWVWSSVNSRRLRRGGITSATDLPGNAVVVLGRLPGILESIG